ncbi:MAG TPA: TlpA disulfide reductase family protein [Bacteroidales bacterium]|nr:TlpA disulfide reductase family protein [Bacteroidales bacterium]
MKKLLVLLLIVAVAAGCKNKNDITIRGTFTGKAPAKIILERNDLDRYVIIDTAKVKKNHFSFKTTITEPEFFQLRTGKNDFVSILALPGENITLTFNGTPLVNNYTVSGSKGSEQVRNLDLRLIQTHNSLDSIRKAYQALSGAELTTMGPSLEKKYTAAIDRQRMFNIRFILDNFKSMASIKALYQRIDDNTYVLYQTRDLQYLKIVSDSLRTVYPESKHVKALVNDVKNELNQMYMDKLNRMAEGKSVARLDPNLFSIKGERVRLSSLRGKYVLLTFFSSASQDCLKENEQLRTLWNKYHSKGLEIYQISLDNDINRWAGYVRYEEIPWISVIEDNPADPAVAKALAITAVPENFLIDKEGNIINSSLHGRNLSIMMDQLFNK